MRVEGIEAYLHELTTAAQQQSLQMSGPISAENDLFERDFRFSLELDGTSDRLVLVLYYLIIDCEAGAQVSAQGLEGIVMPSP